MIGADHAIFWSLGQYHPWPLNQCDVFMRNFCAKCTFTSYWMDSTKPDNKFISGLCLSYRTIFMDSLRSITVPFPSGYHWWDGIEILPWKANQSPERNLTVVYLGSTHTLNPTHTKVRTIFTPLRAIWDYGCLKVMMIFQVTASFDEDSSCDGGAMWSFAPLSLGSDFTLLSWSQYSGCAKRLPQVHDLFACIFGHYQAFPFVDLVA
jgi:hypothetical protein